MEQPGAWFQQKKTRNIFGGRGGHSKTVDIFYTDLKTIAICIKIFQLCSTKNRRFFQEFIDFFENNFGHEKKEKLDEILTQLNILFQIPLKNILQNFQR